MRNMRNWGDTLEGLYASRDRWRNTGVGSLLVAFLLLITLLCLTARATKLEMANKELAGAVVLNCTAIRLGDLAWITVVNGDIICVRTAAVPTREEYVKRVPKVKL